jgi:hypothetical protein
MSRAFWYCSAKWISALFYGILLDWINK